MLNYLKLFWSFCQIGLFSIGGGYAALPLIQAQIVEKHAWLTMQEFMDLITISEMTPGPISLNAASFIGLRVGGPLGVIVASFGNVLPSFFIASFLAFIYYRYQKLDSVQAVIKSLRPTVVGLIATAGFSIVTTALTGSGAIFNAVLMILCLYLLQSKRLGAIQVILLSGFVGVLKVLILS